ncbi:MAG: hypothetical protein E4G97_02850 [Deltaproteobacteria bacterium]|nr:MAG: hypothetical protein E4G97_02850 [Deltaproteobacteria bacterium]
MRDVSEQLPGGPVLGVLHSGGNGTPVQHNPHPCVRLRREQVLPERLGELQHGESRRTGAKAQLAHRAGENPQRRRCRALRRRRRPEREPTECRKRAQDRPPDERRPAPRPAPGCPTGQRPDVGAGTVQHRDRVRRHGRGHLDQHRTRPDHREADRARVLRHERRRVVRGSREDFPVHHNVEIFLYRPDRGYRSDHGQELFVHGLFQPGAPPDTLWPGHIYCRTLYDNGAINPTLRWDAAAPDNVSLSIPVSSSASSRRIFVGLDDSMLSPPFKRGYFSTGTSSWGDPGVTAGDLGLTAGADNVIAWVRGAYFDNNVKLGDIYHSKPILISNPSKIYFDEGFPAYAAAKEFRPRVLYAGANDGMLHAFLAGVYNSSTKTWTNGTGEELFGYIPGSLLSSVQQMVQTGVSDHGYFVDSSPRVADVWWDTNGNNVKEASEWRTVLIGGMRKGGEGYYALDVTDPPTGGDYSNFPKVLWEYSDDTVMAESWSEPVIGKVRIMDAGVARDRFVAILGAGPNIGGGSIGKAVMVLDVRNGQVLRTFTGMGSGVAASPTAILDSSGYIRFAYVVDINGNLWKFDFRTPGNATSSTPDSVWTATKLFTPATGGQPAYHRVEVAYTSTDGSSRYLFYGTGDQESPVTNLGSGKFYGIKDTDAYFPSTAVVETSSNLLDVTPTILNNAAGGTVSTSQSGWVVKLGNVTQSYDGYSHSGEKVLSDPVVFYGRVYFTTFTANTTSPCDGGGIARVYGLDYQTGGAGVIADATISGETSGGRTRVPYHVYGTSGLASSPSLSINPSGQSSIFIGFSATQDPLKIDIESPDHTKILKSWKELF